MTTTAGWAVIDRKAGRVFMPDGTTEPLTRLVDSRCGSPAGYKAHWRRHEQPCTDCRKANSRYQSEWSARSGGAA